MAAKGDLVAHSAGKDENGIVQASELPDVFFEGIGGSILGIDIIAERGCLGKNGRQHRPNW